METTKSKITIVPIEDERAYKDNVVAFDDASLTYVQNRDCTESEDEDDVQTLTITTRNNGVARFLNIKTENWSIEDADELVNIINDFKKRAGID